MGKLLNYSDVSRKYGINRNLIPLLIDLGELPKVSLPGRKQPLIDSDDVEKVIVKFKDDTGDPRIRNMVERIFAEEQE
jgi:hypothetical protein